MQGFVSVYKPSGMSSGSVVNKIKKHFHIDKIGHMGTLDPLASGILPIAIGKATRMFDYFLNKTKRYIAVFDFTYTTDTLDSTGVVTNTSKKDVSMDMLEKVLPQFEGDIMQVPPMYSAKNVGGVRAYKLARAGASVDLKPKCIHIESIKCVKQLDKNIFQFDIVCGSGTYIRSLARDISSALNTCACMISLERIESGKFVKNNSVFLDDLLCQNDLSKFIIPIEKVFASFGQINLDKTNSRLLNGLCVSIDLMEGKYFLMENGSAVAVINVKDKVGVMQTYLKE